MSFVDRIARFSDRVEKNDPIRKYLPLIATLTGVVWVAIEGWWRGGIRSAGDTADYLARVEVLQRNGLSLATLYQEQMLPAHMTTVWMFWLGPTAFVLLTVMLTAFLPLLVLIILRQCQVGILWCLGALWYVGTNPELYQWAWFILTDGFFLVQVLLMLAVITKPTYPRVWWLLIPVMLYNVLYSRPTGIILIPGMLVFAILAPERTRRRFLLTLALLAAMWSVGWIYATGGTRGVHAGIIRDTFVSGHLLQDPRMSEPLAVPFTQEQAIGRSLGKLCASYLSYCVEYYSRKWFTYFLPAFPRYSLRHKMFNAIYFGSLIVLSVAAVVIFARNGWRWGWKQLSASHAQVRAGFFCMVVMLTAGVFHTATHIDSDARFLMVWTPVWVCGVFLAIALAVEKLRPSVAIETRVSHPIREAFTR